MQCCLWHLQVEWVAARTQAHLAVVPWGKRIITVESWCVALVREVDALIAGVAARGQLQVGFLQDLLVSFP